MVKVTKQFVIQSHRFGNLSAEFTSSGLRTFNPASRTETGDGRKQSRKIDFQLVFISKKQILCRIQVCTSSNEENES